MFLFVWCCLHTVAAEPVQQLMSMNCRSLARVTQRCPSCVVDAPFSRSASVTVVADVAACSSSVGNCGSISPRYAVNF